MSCLFSKPVLLCQQMNKKGGKIWMYRKLNSNTGDVDDMIYGSTITVPSDR